MITPKLFLRPRPKQRDKKSSTESKAKLELLTKRIWDDADEIEDIVAIQRKGEDIVAIQRKGSQIEEVENPISLYEKRLLRKGLGYQQVASRGYEINPKNIVAYDELALQFDEAYKEDPDMIEPYTRDVFSLYTRANNNLLQLTITTPQTNVEVVDVEPTVKIITVPSWGKMPGTDMEDKKEDE